MSLDADISFCFFDDFSKVSQELNGFRLYVRLSQIKKRESLALTLIDCSLSTATDIWSGLVSCLKRRLISLSCSGVKYSLTSCLGASTFVAFGILNASAISRFDSE